MRCCVLSVRYIVTLIQSTLRRRLAPELLSRHASNAFQDDVQVLPMLNPTESSDSFRRQLGSYPTNGEVMDRRSAL